MQRCDVSCAKRACVLFIKEIRDIVMGSDSDEEKYYASHCRGQRATPTFATIFPFTTSKSRLFCQQLWRWWFGNVAGQQPQPSQCTMPPKPRRRVVRALIGAPLSKTLERAGNEPRPFMPVGRPVQAFTNIWRLDTSHNKHWPGRNHTKRRYCVHSVGGVKQTVIFRCVKCDVALCVDRNCFHDYHTKTNL